MLKALKKTIPKHVAIIMDGNGRWAKQRGFSRTKGHEQGAKTVREITTYAQKIGIKYLTLYAFSTENWGRPKLEVNFLMKLLEDYLKSELEVYKKNNIKFKTIGDLSKFSSSLQEIIALNVEETKTCTGLTQILALNYGSKDEIVRAVKNTLEQELAINEENIDKNLDTNEFGDVDLLIRTSGELRLSNFLLWQCAYAEMFFTTTLWPDFSSSEFADILAKFHSRKRRFGLV